MESAKADLRARIFELERQKTTEVRKIDSQPIDSDSTLEVTREDVKIVDKQKSAEYRGADARQVEIECLDSSSPYDTKTSEASKA